MSTFYEVQVKAWKTVLVEMPSGTITEQQESEAIELAVEEAFSFCNNFEASARVLSTESEIDAVGRHADEIVYLEEEDE